MPSARGLFHRAIAQSVPGTFFSRELAADIMAAIADRLGLQPTVSDLSRVPPLELVAAGDALRADMINHANRWGAVASTPTPFSPVVDGDVLPTTPWRALREGAGRDVELILGHNRDEFRLFITMFGLLGRISDDLVSEALTTFAPDPVAYRKAFSDASPAALFELVQSDWLFRMPTLHLAEAQVVGGGRAHVYELTWGAPGHDGALGACHGLDISLVFGNFSTGPLVPLFYEGGVPVDAETVSGHFRAAWTAFAATGDPGWSHFDIERRCTALFDIDVTTASYPEEESRQLWSDHEFQPLPLYDRH
jgi:para-nitrobenzyl esterase